MKKTFLLIATIAISFSSAFAQNWCGSMDYRQQKFENSSKALAEAEQRLAAFNAVQDEFLANSTKQDEDTYIIPVVFHIIHQNGSENISVDQIEDQLRVINEDFSRTNADTVNTPSPFVPYAGNANIEFRLAKLDPHGNCTDGITRTYSPLTLAARDNVKALIQWNPQRYLNVWVVKTIENFSSSGGIILGFAQFPDDLSSDPETDGIVIRHDYCGTVGTANGTYGRTLTHEVGHWLNLRHIWGDADCGDDFVNDTPTALEPNYGVCDTNGDAAGGAYPYHANSCSASGQQTISQEFGEMFMNYMDYSDDHCMNMFSGNQAARMRLVMTQYRTLIATSSNLNNTGTSDDYDAEACTPVVEFYSSSSSVCTDTEINFSDGTFNTSFEDIISWEWSFPGANIASSTEQHPSVVYNEAGVYDVSLTVTNSSGASTLNKEGYITVLSLDAALVYPMIQSFETSTFPYFGNNPDVDWRILPTIDDTWARTTDAASNGSLASLKIRSNDFTQLSEVHTLIAPSIDLTEASSPLRMYFDLAYAKRNSSSMDELKVYVSTNCGKSWTKRFDKDTDDLTTNGGANEFFDFVPDADEWEQFSMSLSSYAGDENVLFKFEFTGEGGNWLYIDNVLVAMTGDLSIDENRTLASFHVFPNPSQGDATIEFDLLLGAEVKLLLTNIYGQSVGAISQSFKAGAHNLKLSELNNSISPGVYLLHLEQNGKKSIKKIVLTE
jgi:PKD repeat protein